jgi:DNA-binding transcriptional ArsR family regulator
VNELAAPFEMSQPAISRHLKVLEDAQLISRRTEGTTRPCRLEAAGMQGVEQWLAMMREALSRNFDRLDGVLASMQAEARRPRPGRHGKDKTPRKRSTRS